MKIIIPRTGELDPNAAAVVPQELRDRIWAAFVTSWLDKHHEEFRDMITADAPDKPAE